MNRETVNEVKGHQYGKLGKALEHLHHVVSVAQSQAATSAIRRSISKGYSEHFLEFFMKNGVSENFLNVLPQDAAEDAISNLLDKERSERKCLAASMDGNFEQSFKELADVFQDIASKKHENLQHETWKNRTTEQEAVLKTLEDLCSCSFDHLFNSEKMVSILRSMQEGTRSKKESGVNESFRSYDYLQPLLKLADEIMEESLDKVFRSPAARFDRAFKAKNVQELGRAFEEKAKEIVRNSRRR